ncbi:MAG: NAD(P)/FAD-dependent oxidoreductase [Nannocystales bacterium]
MTDVIVIGGGPAGSTAAAAVARHGHDVLLLEASEHPRPHVGESLLPGIIPILDDIGALPKVEAAGFARKTGSTLVDWGRTPRWDLWFADSDAYDHAWFVERARFDALLFEHAGSVGAKAHSRAPVRAVLEHEGRICGVRWQDRDTGVEHETHASVVIDASGQSGLVSRAHAPRDHIDGLKHQALWAHFRGTSGLPSPRQEQAFFVAQEQQWFWMFPLANGRASVGVVQLDSAGRRSAPRPDYDALVAGCPELISALGPTAQRESEIRAERDWSYRSRRPAGAGWYAIGDAAGFIDPVLSTGVMLALHSGWLAAQCAHDELRGARTSEQACEYYLGKHREMFDDLLRMVRFYYRQNAFRDDYFWESKRILDADGERLQPQKAFILLTSGLVSNLALDARVDARSAKTDGTTLQATPEYLDFIGVHLRVLDRDAAQASTEGDVPVRGSSLFLLVEPLDPSAPTLIRTASTHVNAIAPRHGNDPISVPLLAPVIRSFAEVIRQHDPGLPDLAALWRLLREPLQAWADALPDGFEWVRAFGD